MIRGYETFAGEQTINRLSMAVRLIDDYTAIAMPIGHVNVFIRDLNLRAFKNASAYYLFIDLPTGTYNLVVDADYYFAAEQAVDTATLDPTSPIVDVTLTPQGTYPFPAGATLIRGVVREAGGEAIQGASVHALIMLPQTTVKARVNQGGAAAGDASLRLVNIAGAISVGDILMLRDTQSARSEFVTIVAPLPADPATEPFAILAPLQFGHPTGTPLQLMVVDSALDTQTTEGGELVVYCRLLKAGKFLARVTVSYPAHQAAERQVEVNEGRLTSLGIIQLAPI
jgi:hypothetical protein